ncbi:MAG: DUF5696 domain-containing protein [Acutalibacteraceae bacterium]
MTLIKKALAVVCMLSLTLGVLSGCSGKLSEAKVSVLSEHASDEGFDEAYDNIVLENERLRFEMDISTTHFKITDKNSGKQYYSVSQESESVDETEAARMQSEISLSYYEEQSDAMYMFSDTDSVQSGNYRVLTNGNSIRVYYSMGFVDALIPKILDTDTFELLMDKLGSDSLRRRFERYYVLYSSNEETDGLSEMIKKYPILKKQDLYILSDSLSDIELNDISDYIAQTDFSKEDYLQMLDKLDIEYESGGDSAGFMVPIEYSLTSDGFSAEILTDLIEESSDEYKLQSIDLLEYFASVTTSEGYFLIPDGSGAIVPFSQEGGQLSMPYYGENYTKNIESASVFTNNLSLPVFGISLSDGGIFAVVKKGSEASTLNLSVVSEASTCNHIFVSFEIRAVDSTDYGANMQIPIYNLFAKERVASDLEVQYHLLTADANDYSDMAELYRADVTFEETGGYDAAPVYVDYLCMITEEASMMGVPYTKKIVLSTIDEIYASVQKLIEADIGPVIVRLFGYSSSGSEHKVYSKFQIDKNVGTVSQVIELKQLLEESGGKLYFDSDMQFAYESGNGFSVSDNSARYLNRLVVCRGDHDIVSRAYSSSNQLRYLISPLYYPSIAESMMSSLDKKIGKVGLSYGSSGVYLGGDYAKGRNLDRCESADLIVQALNKAKENGFETAFDVGNSYVLPYASHLLNVPSTSSEYKLEETAVPFYQMVVHGSISYAGSPYNMSSNNLSSVCDSYAFGSAPYAVFITREDNLIANTNYETKWYSLEDGKRLDDFIQTAKNTYDLRKKTSGSRIIGYSEISDGVSSTSYDNGIIVYVNRNNSDCTVNGLTVAANGFTVGGN